MKNARVTPYPKMKVWDGTGPGKIEFSGDLGHVIEQKIITGALVDTMREVPNLEIISDKIENISFQDK
jgi:2-polyprenyl-6-methoxyphenol hydroxylase-like FAD-dependent oxidoreductase